MITNNNMTCIVIANILYNTAVIWSAIMAWVFLGEKLTRLQIYGLAVSILSLLLITWSAVLNPTEEASEKTNNTSTTLFIVGCMLCLITAVGLGVITVWTRMMQTILFSVIFTYYGLMSTFLIGSTLIGESLYKSETMHILTYSKEQYLYALIPSSINYSSTRVNHIHMFTPHKHEVADRCT